MPPVGFEPTISAGERPQTHALDQTATGTGVLGISSAVQMTMYCLESTNVALLVHLFGFFN